MKSKKVNRERVDKLIQIFKEDGYNNAFGLEILKYMSAHVEVELTSDEMFNLLRHTFERAGGIILTWYLDLPEDIIGLQYHGYVRERCIEAVLYVYQIRNINEILYKDVKKDSLYYFAIELVKEQIFAVYGEYRTILLMNKLGWIGECTLEKLTTMCERLSKKTLFVKGEHITSKKQFKAKYLDAKTLLKDIEILFGNE